MAECLTRERSERDHANGCERACASECPPPLFELRRGLAGALRAKAEACRGARRGEAPRRIMDIRRVDVEATVISGHAIADRIGRHIEFLDGQIIEIETEISTLIKAEPEISDDARLMRSLPGVGPVACMQLIAQMPELGKVGPKKVAALAGLAPFNVDSGTFRGKRKIAGGRKRVRDALYMAALNAVRRADPFKAFYLRLRQVGKPAKLALIAVARKLFNLDKELKRPGRDKAEEADSSGPQAPPSGRKATCR